MSRWNEASFAAHRSRTDDDGGGAPAEWKIVGPGLVVAATGVGAADMVATLVAGSRHGYGLLWEVVLLRRSAELVPSGTVGVQYLDPRSPIYTFGIPLHPGAAIAYRTLHG